MQVQYCIRGGLTFVETDILLMYVWGEAGFASLCTPYFIKLSRFEMMHSLLPARSEDGIGGRRKRADV
jgi:hypothetical protein